MDLEDIVGFISRLGLAFGLFFKVLSDTALASRAAGLLTQPEEDTTPSSFVPEPAATPEAPTDTSALQLMAALQREGRFIDFVQEDVQSLADDDIGGAARLVHEGCRKVISKWFAITPVWPGEEGTSVTLEEGFDAKRVQLTGNVTGEPPFSGTLAHHGWAVDETKLPTLTRGADPSVLAPAEVEL